MTTHAIARETARPRRSRWMAAAWISLLLLTLLAIVTVLLGTTARAAWAKERSSGDERSRRSGKDFDWQGEMRPGMTLEVHGINGSIHARAASGRGAQVNARKSGRRSDPDEVRIEVEETRDGVRICALYPRPDGKLNTDCKSQNTRNNDVQVEFHLEVPDGVHLVTGTVNGEVEVDNLSGNVEASTVNGGVDLSTSGEAEAHTVNGGIHARVGTASWSGTMSFETVNGSVVVTLPERVSAEVDASTVNGDIESDFELAVTGRIRRQRIRGTIGEGRGGQLTLATINGGIELRSARSASRKR